jgi:hypothetical protein
LAHTLGCQQYFAKPQLKVVEDEKAVRIVMELDENTAQSFPIDEDDNEKAETAIAYGNGTKSSHLQPQSTVTNRQSVVINAVGSRLSFMPGPTWNMQLPSQPPPTRTSMRLPTSERSRVMRISYIA